MLLGRSGVGDTATAVVSHRTRDDVAPIERDKGLLVLPLGLFCLVSRLKRVVDRAIYYALYDFIALSAFAELTDWPRAPSNELLSRLHKGLCMKT